MLSYPPKGNLATKEEPYFGLNSGREAQKLFFNCGGQGCCKISDDNQEKEVIKKNQTIEPLAKFNKLPVVIRQRQGNGSLKSMKPCLSVLLARKRADFSAYGTHHSLEHLTKPRPAWGRSVEQFEQLVGEQGDHAKHQV